MTLEEKYPAFFEQCSAAVPDAWLGILDELCQKIVDRFGQDAAGVKCWHVKEKFGSLRISYSVRDGYTLDCCFIEDLFDGIEENSEMFCTEGSASEAMMVPLGWVHPLCPEHMKVWRQPADLGSVTPTSRSRG